MQRGRAPFDHTNHTPEMKVRLTETLAQALVAIEKDCPDINEDHRQALSAAIAEALTALADAIKRDVDRICGLAEGSGGRSSGLFRDHW
jgi:hypothetical protein